MGFGCVNCNDKNLVIHCPLAHRNWSCRLHCDGVIGVVVGVVVGDIVGDVGHGGGDGPLPLPSLSPLPLSACRACWATPS